MAPLPHGPEWDFDLIERYHAAITETAARVRPRHLSQPDRDHHLRADARRLRVHRAADRLPALVVRQGVHPQRAGLREGRAGARLRDRDQLQPVHRLPHGGQHPHDAGAGDRARELRAQLVLQGQLPLPPVDRGRRHPRLPRVRAALRAGMRGAPRRRRRGGRPRFLPRAHALRRRPLQARGQALARQGESARGAPRERPGAPLQRPVAHAARRRGQPRGGRSRALPGRARGERPLLHREELAQARDLAAGAGAHRAQALAVFLSRRARPRS